MVELREYQKGIVRAELDNNNLLINAPMGSGKTLSTLTALAAMFYTGRIKNALIIAPKRVALSVWAQEVDNFEMGLNIRICRRALEIKEYIHNNKTHRIVVVPVSMIHEIPHGCWDVVIADESTLFGNQDSSRSKQMRRLCCHINTPQWRSKAGYFPQGEDENGAPLLVRGRRQPKIVQKRILLSGTPFHRGYEKLFHQIFVLDGGKSLDVSTLTEYRSKYMRLAYMISGVTAKYEVIPEKIPEILQRIKHLIYVVRDSAPLPPCLYKDIYLGLPAKRRAEYEEFEREAILWFKGEPSGGDPYGEDVKKLVAFAKTAKGSKLRQLATGAVYTNEKRTEYTVTHTEKIEALKEIRETYDGGILVAYEFISEKEAILKAFPKARTLDSAKDIEDWNNGLIDMAVGHSLSLGHGLNLQFGGHVIVWYSLTYDAETYSQFNARLNRHGQKETVSIIRFIMGDTIEERVLNTLLRKEDMAEDALKYL